MPHGNSDTARQHFDYHSVASAEANAGARYRSAYTLLASLFLMWGFITVTNNTLLPHLRSLFDLTYIQTQLVALFIIVIGITLLQVAANPYVAVVGWPATRLNLVQAFNSAGATFATPFGGYLILERSTSGTEVVGAVALTPAERLSVGLFYSIMFPTIFTLGIRGLGPLTEDRSGQLIMAIAGGRARLAGRYERIAVIVPADRGVRTLCAVHALWGSRTTAAVPGRATS